ncbi:hypothetical protein K227x_35290 [Rubripirellula lacrimiformis]|uniref:Uncharacterized protein n=1 Tax=Rubripirellula lacrimiformis TaxID=1930273 RepID=A0A517NDC4_9BACT|nr:hypothetical protein K227x_35290 [Rubripirellula lacrimiformis]
MTMVMVMLCKMNMGTSGMVVRFVYASPCMRMRQRLPQNEHGN